MRSQGYRATLARSSPTTRRSSRRGLLAHGVARGDRVGIWSPNRYEWVVAQFACARIGAILVNINPAYKTAELEYALAQSGDEPAAPRARLSHERLRRHARRGAPAPARRCARPSSFDDDWAAARRRRPRRPTGELAAREARCRSTTRSTSSTPRAPPASPRARRSRTTTSSTTATSSAARCRLAERDRVCIPVPFYHCFGMVLGNLACVAHGASMVVPGEAFDAGRVLETVAAERCTSLYGVPTMFIAELDHPRLRRARSDVAAHRHHGRLALPGRGDAPGAETHAHAAR